MENISFVQQTPNTTLDTKTNYPEKETCLNIFAKYKEDLGATNPMSIWQDSIRLLNRSLIPRTITRNMNPKNAVTLATIYKWHE